MNNKNFMNRQSMNRQGGFTLLEVLIAVTAGALVLFLGVRAYNYVIDNIESSDLQSQVTTFSTVLKLSCQNKDCSNVSTANVLASQRLKEFHNSDDTAINAVSGAAITFTSGDIGTGSDNAVSQLHPGVTQRVCSLGVAKLWQQVELINVNAVAVKAGANDSLDDSAINANCNLDENSIEFITRG